VTQPDQIPVAVSERVRPDEPTPVPDAWRADRPADLRGLSPRGTRLGSAGPDLGYGLKLARRLAGRTRLAPDEHDEDAVAGCFAVGTARASLFGRAPVIYDMELAYRLWGFLDGAPADLVAFRVPLFRGAAHHYWDQRAIVDRVPESTLRLTPAEVAARLGDWRSLVVTDGSGADPA
jgi:hypothetical protein